KLRLQGGNLSLECRNVWITVDERIFAGALRRDLLTKRGCGQADERCKGQPKTNSLQHKPASSDHCGPLTGARSRSEPARRRHSQSPSSITAGAARPGEPKNGQRQRLVIGMMLHLAAQLAWRAWAAGSGGHVR